MHTLVHISIHLYISTCTYKHAYICTCIHIHAHTHTHTYSHHGTWVPGSSVFPRAVGCCRHMRVGGSRVQWQSSLARASDSFLSRSERGVRSIWNFYIGHKTRASISPGSSPEEGPGSSCAVLGGCRFPLQQEGSHSTVWTGAPRGLTHTHTLPVLYSLFCVLLFCALKLFYISM